MASQPSLHVAPLVDDVARRSWQHMRSRSMTTPGELSRGSSQERGGLVRRAAHETPPLPPRAAHETPPLPPRSELADGSVDSQASQATLTARPSWAAGCLQRRSAPRGVPAVVQRVVPHGHNPCAGTLAGSAPVGSAGGSGSYPVGTSVSAENNHCAVGPQRVHSRGPSPSPPHSPPWPTTASPPISSRGGIAPGGALGPRPSPRSAPPSSAYPALIRMG